MSVKLWFKRLSTGKRVGVVIVSAIVICIAAVLLGWLGYATTAWAGYGRFGIDHRADPLADRFIPTYEVAERHEMRVAAPSIYTYAAECAVDLQRSAVIRAIFRGRELMLGAPPDTAASPSPFVQQAVSMGWGMLAEAPGRELVMGAVTQPWEPHVTFHPLPPDQFAKFQKPGYVKIVWTLEAEATGVASSVARTVTRVQTTDEQSRRKFRTYWATFSPGILLIRYQALDVVRDDAEQRFDRHDTTGAASCFAAPPTRGDRVRNGTGKP